LSDRLNSGLHGTLQLEMKCGEQIRSQMTGAFISIVQALLMANSTLQATTEGYMHMTQRLETTCGITMLATPV